MVSIAVLVEGVMVTSSSLAGIIKVAIIWGIGAASMVILAEETRNLGLLIPVYLVDIAEKVGDLRVSNSITIVITVAINLVVIFKVISCG